MKLHSVLLILGLFSIATNIAFAGVGPSMPWDSGLDTLVKNLTGKTALAVGVLALFLAGAGLVFGGEMTEFVRKMLMLIMAIAVVVSATSLMNILFGITGGLVA